MKLRNSYSNFGQKSEPLIFQVKEIYLKEASDALEEKRIAELALVEAKKGNFESNQMCYYDAFGYISNYYKKTRPYFKCIKVISKLYSEVIKYQKQTKLNFSSYRIHDEAKLKFQLNHEFYQILFY